MKKFLYTVMKFIYFSMIAAFLVSFVDDIFELLNMNLVKQLYFKGLFLVWGLLSFVPIYINWVIYDEVGIPFTKIKWQKK